MTLRMGDGPVANLPAGLDAYAGYTNRSGIGITYPQVVARFPNARHLSITTDGIAALCADVEKGAMSGWAGYSYGYCSVSRVNELVAAYGRPKKLWTSHYNPKLGAHICAPGCYPGLLHAADGTQWVDHGGWDESLLADDFFDLQPAPSPPAPPPTNFPGENMTKTPINVLIANGEGWYPTPVSADKIITVTVEDQNPDVHGAGASIPTFVGYSAEVGKHSPNGSLNFKGGSNGSWGAVVWSVD